MNNFDDDYRGITPRRSVHLEILTDDGREFLPLCEGPLQVVMPTNIGLLARDIGIEWLKKLGAKFAAVRIFADNQMFVYSIYDRACEFFEVKVLTVGQMPFFRSLL